MAVSKQLVRGYLVYDFKDGLSIVTECVNPVGIMLSVNALPDTLVSEFHGGRSVSL